MGACEHEDWWPVDGGYFDTDDDSLEFDIRCLDCDADGKAHIQFGELATVADPIDGEWSGGVESKPVHAELREHGYATLPGMGE